MRIFVETGNDVAEGQDGVQVRKSVEEKKVVVRSSSRVL